MTRRVLVTGAGGFIGRWSVPELRAAGDEVHVVSSGNSAAELPGQLAGTFVHVADLLDSAAIDVLMDAVMPTHLLHFAWIATPGVYLNSAENFRWLTSSEHLLRSFRAHGGERAVFAGTCAEYDWARATVCHESSTPLGHGAAGAPPAAYAACKIALQETLAEVSRESGLSTAWGRIFFQFGPAENPGRLVPSVIINLLMNRDAPCSHGRQVRSFLHAADVGSAFAALLHSDVQGPVNIGSADPISVRALIELIAERTGGGQRLRFGALEAAAREPPLLVPDTTRLTAEVGWQPRLTLPDGLDRTIDWWRHRLGESRSG